MSDPSVRVSVQLEGDYGEIVAEGTPEEVARSWLGLDRQTHINLLLHPRVVEAFASTPPLIEGFIACGGSGDLTPGDRQTINQFAAFLQAVGDIKREKEAASGG